MIPGTPVAGKTGTTTNTVDLWFVGYVPNGLCAAVWTGYDEAVNITTEEVYHETMYANIMGQVVDVKGLAGGEFTIPEGIVQAYAYKKSGRVPTEICEWDDCAIAEFFEADNVPAEYCDTHFTVEVCSSSHLLPIEGCPTETMICINRPPDVTGEPAKGETADSAKQAPYEYCTGVHKKDKNKDKNKDKDGDEDDEDEDEDEDEEEVRETEPVGDDGGY